jgi:ribokinase
MPKSGETIHSQNFEVGNGGKGANQAIAARRLGSSVAMIGKLGDDPHGREYKKYFQNEGINTEHLENVKGCTSGVALIVVDTSNGENQIVINANANECLREKDIGAAKDILDNSKVNLI